MDWEQPIKMSTFFFINEFNSHETQNVDSKMIFVVISAKIQIEFGLAEYVMTMTSSWKLFILHV